MSDRARRELAMPERVDPSDEADLIRSAQQHLIALRASRKLGVGLVNRSAKPKDVEIPGQILSHEQGRELLGQRRLPPFLSRHRPGRHDEADEVDDDWFGLDDGDEAQRTVRLSIGKVPKRVAARVGRKRRERLAATESRGARGPPGPADDGGAFSDDDGGDRYELETRENAGGALLMRSDGTFASEDDRAAGSGADDADSLVTLELPSRPDNTSSPATTDSPDALTRIASPASGRNLFPVTSAASSAATSQAPIAADPAFERPSRTLTIDEQRRPKVSRRTTALSAIKAHGGSRNKPTNEAPPIQPRGYRIPGRRKFHDHRAAKKGRQSRAESNQAEFELSVAEALKQAGVVEDEEERVECDVLWEHQRGLVVFGLPKFSGNALFQADPSNWCDASFKPSPFNPHTFPCPPYWIWRDSEFMIDCSGDKDEEGWSYAIRFRSRYWRGEAQPIRSFVRRRCWVRTRVYRPEPLVPPKLQHARALETSLGISDVASHPELGPCGARALGTTPVARISDLRTACAALPVPEEDKMLVFTDSTAPASFLPGGAVDPRNPFLSYKRIRLDGAAALGSASGPGGQKASNLEPIWREAVVEINFRRLLGVLRARTKVDRQRIELFRLWFGEYDQKRKLKTPIVQNEAALGPHESTQKHGAKAIVAATKIMAGKERTEIWDPQAGEGTECDVEDVWDVVEKRLDELLQLFDYEVAKQTFLSVLLDIHPAKHFHHRYQGYDTSSADRRAKLEQGLEARLAFYEEVEKLVEHYGGKGGWIPAVPDEQVGADRNL